MKGETTRNFEIRLLLETLSHRLGFDFKHYAQASVQRRLLQSLSSCDIEHISEAIPRLLHDPLFLRKIFYTLSVTVTEFFRDPSFYRIMRQKVVPILKTYPFINVWHAGCATGEEVYSMAILLQEEGLYDRARIYATDINDKSLQLAADGVFQMDDLRECAPNYKKAGGKGSLSDYYHAKYDLAVVDSSLKKNIVFSSFNLVTDNVFTETHVVFCRNVLIYFDRTLQNLVLNLLHDGLVHGGILGLGSGETIEFTNVADYFTPVSKKWRVFQKRGTLRDDYHHDTLSDPLSLIPSSDSLKVPEVPEPSGSLSSLDRS